MATQNEDRGVNLTPHERIKAAYLVEVRGVSVQDVAIAFNVNMGRVSEAVAAVTLAAADPRLVRRLAQGGTDG
jgi:hypothetical protein